MPLERSILDRTFATPLGEAAYQVCEKLLDAGYDTWWVGGAVRDMLQGKTPDDIDIATAATPTQMLAVFPDADCASAALGSLRITLHRQTFEVTTFRRDDEASDGRHPESIAFSDREHDAARRDFSINAIYLQPISRALFDPYGGEADVREKLIRFIGDPVIRITHDALRMLRAVRFRAAIDGQYHPKTYAALQAHSELTAALSGERVRMECEKMLLGAHPDLALEDLWELGVLKAVLPELHVCKGIAQPAQYHQEGDVWNHLLACCSAFVPEDGADIRWAALLHDIGKATTFSVEERIRFDHHAEESARLAGIVLRRLQFPRQRSDAIVWIIRHHMMMGSFLDMPEERKAHWYYHPLFNDLLRLFALDIEGTMPKDFSLLDKIIADYTQYLDTHPRPAVPLLTGTEIMEILHLRPGEEVGRVRKLLLDAQQRGEITLKKEATDFVRSLQGTQGG